VLDYSPQARGAAPGMPLQEAVSLCQDAVLLETDEPYYQAGFQEMLQALEQRSPLVEPADLGCAYVGLDGLEAMYGGDARLVTALLQSVHRQLSPRVGTAGGKFPAYLAAATSDAGRATRVPENVGDFLGRFSINLLPLSWESKARLLHLGLHTLGQIARQPVGALQAQLGFEGQQAWELARGIDRRPLVPRQPETVVTEHLTFPSPYVTAPGILLAIQSLLGRAFSRQEARGRYARSVVIESQVHHHPPWVRRFDFKEATGGRERAFSIIKNALDPLVLPGPLEDMTLSLLGLTGESGIQGSLFSDVRRQEQLRETVRQLKVRWGGRPQIYTARDLEPWSVVPERQKVLVPFDP
jgi:DNA polymerase IV